MLQQILDWIRTLPQDVQGPVAIALIIVAGLVVAGIAVLVWRVGLSLITGVWSALGLSIGAIAIIALLLIALTSTNPIDLPFGMGQIGGNGQVINIVPPSVGEAITGASTKMGPAVVGQPNSQLQYLQELAYQDQQASRILGGLKETQMITNTASLQDATNRLLLATNLAVNEPKLTPFVWGYLNGYAQTVQDLAMILASSNPKVAMPQGINTSLARLAAKAPEVQGAERQCTALPLGRITNQAEWERETYRIYMCGDLVSAQVAAEMVKTSPDQGRLSKLNEQMGMLTATASRLDVSWAAYQTANPLTAPRPVTTPTSLP